MYNPYAQVNWRTVRRLASATHMHVPQQATLERGYRHGIRHFPVSNYYPSAPHDATTRPSDFRLRQHWPARRVDGTVLPPPINWNEVITWADELAEPYRSQFPFRAQPGVYTDIPADVIFSPNAEHHGWTDSEAHICSPGSEFISGNFDVRGYFGLPRHGFCVGYGGPWREGFREILAELRYPDGGGITLNHPCWFSGLTDAQVLELLDFDPRVLGIEIYNDYSGRRDWTQTPGYRFPAEPAPGFSLNLWDRILTSGRRCWGFCVPDHSVEPGWPGQRADFKAHATDNWRGRSVLLVPAATDRDCLRAYRSGAFYGCLLDQGLTVTDFAASPQELSVAISAPARIRVIADGQPLLTAHGSSATCTIPQQDGQPAVAYVRVEVADDAGEQLFLQPVLFGAGGQDATCA